MPIRRATVLDDLFSLQVIQTATLSSNGEQTVYDLSRYEPEEDRMVSQLWLYAYRSDRTRQLTFGLHSNHSPRWSPDDQQIAFLSDRPNRTGRPDQTEATQLYRLDLSGAEAQALTDLPQGVNGPFLWSPDGGQIVFSAGMPVEERPDLSQPYRVTRHVYRSDTIGYLDGAIQNLFVVDIETGVIKQLTGGVCRYRVLDWSPDGAHLLCALTHRPETHRADFMELAVIGTANGAVTPLLEGWGLIKSAIWHPDGDKLLFMGIPAGEKRGTKADLYVVDSAGTTEPVNRTSDLREGVGSDIIDGLPTGMYGAGRNLFCSADGQFGYAHVQIGGTIHLYRFSLSGEQRADPIIAGERVTYLLGIDQTETGFLVAEGGFNRPYDLLLVDIDKREERQITATNEQLLTMLQPAKIEHLKFNGRDGEAVEGWLMRPPQAEGPLPTLIKAHGGPHAAYGHAYCFDAQMLVGAGFAVLMINHRGSSGYGTPFGTAAIGDWGNLDHGDLMAGLDFAIAQGWADPDRLGIFGLSGGGYLSCWAITQTGRFKAAVPENPVTNWRSFYGTSDIGVRFAVSQMGDHPHLVPETYTRCSPITFAHQCTTPTLLIQGEADYRCPAEQSEQFYNVLKANGCIVEMLRLPNSPHAGSIVGAPATRRARHAALLEWMVKYILTDL